MSDSVRCNLDSSTTFTCEVSVDSDFSASSAAGIPPAVAASPAKPAPGGAVSSLVNAYSKVAIPRAEAPVVTAESLATCVSAELSLPIATAVVR